MPASISNHGQSTLPDGRVLVSGGIGGGITNTVYIYEPSSNIWGKVADLPDRVYGHGQSTLNDGMVFVSGGFDSSSKNSNTANIYNTDNNTWASAAPMLIGAHGVRHAVSIDGMVFTVGGYNYDIGNLGIKDTQVYKPNTNTWASASPMPIANWWMGHSVLNDGKVIVSGGSGINGFINSVYIYTVENDAWIKVADMPVAATYVGQSTLMNGMALVSGGAYYTGSYIAINNVHVYNSPTNTWTPVASLPVSFYLHGQSTLADGRVLVSGGGNDSGTLNTAYIYTPAGWVAHTFVCFFHRELADQLQ